MKKRLQSFVYAGRGIWSVFRSEPNMQIHIVIAVLVLIFGFIFQLSTTEWILCLFCMALVMGMEMLNTAVENIVNLVSPAYHPLAGKAKDIAAGAVLICAFVSALVGLIIFVPKVWVFVQSLFVI